MTRHSQLFCCLVLAALALTACKPQVTSTDSTADPSAAGAASAQATAALAPEAATETTMAVADAQPGTGDFDAGAFAGTFTGTLPCADCPGIDETLQLKADGSFDLTDRYRERPDGAHALHGTWSAEADGSRIHLDPDNKRDVDRMFAIDDHDTLTQLGMDGTRIQSDLNFSLKRGE